jgi:hypothetical protein
MPWSEANKHRLHQGHYTIVRKVGKEWWYCDDSCRKGVTAVPPGDLQSHQDGCVFLLKKGGLDEIEKAD